MTRLSKKIKVVTTLETIPHELATEILSRVAASSVADISTVKLSSKKLKEAAEDAHVYQHACLDKFPILNCYIGKPHPHAWKQLSEKQQFFLNKCRQSSNPELLYREALVDYFNQTKIRSACQKLDKASKLGHSGALYVSCIVSLFSNDDELKRKGIKLIGDMRKTTKSSKRNIIRLCRKKLFEDLNEMWVNNPVLKEHPKCCTEHRPNVCTSHVLWREEEIENEDEEDEDDDKCEACSADKELLRFISDIGNYICD